MTGESEEPSKERSIGEAPGKCREARARGQGQIKQRSTGGVADGGAELPWLASNRNGNRESKACACRAVASCRRWEPPPKVRWPRTP